MEKFHEFKGNTRAKEIQASEIYRAHKKNQIRSCFAAFSLIVPPFGTGIHIVNNHIKSYEASFANSPDSESVIPNSIPQSTTIYQSNETSSIPPTTYPQRPNPSTRVHTANNESVSKSQSWTGLASYYSRDGCLGCNPERIMANGMPLNDNKLTVAFNRAPLGARLLITNLDNLASVEAEVTDTGGFERYGKIVDLNLGTKNALGCKSTCKVHIDLL